MLQSRMRRPRSARPRRAPFQTSLRVAVVLAFVLLDASSVSAGPWKGKETTDENGVLQVMNPSQAIEKATTVDLDELWRLGGDSEDEDEFFGIIAQIRTGPDENIYVLDSQLSEVKIYDSNGEWLNSIGREGEGPGEFRRANNMFFLPDGTLGVMQAVPGKIVKLTLEGDPAGDVPLPQPEGGGFQLLRGAAVSGDNLILIRQLQTFAEGKGTQTVSMDLVDPEGNIVTTFTTTERHFDMANLVISEKTFYTFEQTGRWAAAGDGRVYVLQDYLDYAITVYNADGTKDRVIRRDYEHRKRSQEEIDRILGIWEVFLRQAPNAKADIGEFDFDCQRIYPRDDGSLWVLTAHGSRDLPDGALGVFDVFDDKGRYVREVTLRGQGDPHDDGYFFVGDRLYVVTGWLDAIVAREGGAEGAEEDEDAMPMELICYRLDAPVIAKGE